MPDINSEDQATPITKNSLSVTINFDLSASNFLAISQFLDCILLISCLTLMQCLAVRMKNIIFAMLVINKGVTKWTTFDKLSENSKNILLNLLSVWWVSWWTACFICIYCLHKLFSYLKWNIFYNQCQDWVCYHAHKSPNDPWLQYMSLLLMEQKMNINCNKETFVCRVSVAFLPYLL